MERRDETSREPWRLRHSCVPAASRQDAAAQAVQEAETNPAPSQSPDGQDCVGGTIAGAVRGASPPLVVRFGYDLPHPHSKGRSPTTNDTRDETRTRIALSCWRILSPLCLPIPPPGRGCRRKIIGAARPHDPRARSAGGAPGACEPIPARAMAGRWASGPRPSRCGCGPTPATDGAPAPAGS